MTSATQSAQFVLATIALMACASTIAADDAAPELTPRGPARIIALVVPDFPADLVAQESSLEVRVRLEVDERGLARNVVIESTPSAVDQEVVRAAALWFVVPNVCGDSKWTARAVRTTIVFSKEGEKRFVTLRDPRWYSAGEDQILPGAKTDNTEPQLKLREPIARPQFPREAIARRVAKGIVVGILQYGADGKPVDIVRMFQWPSDVFEREVRDAVMSWDVDPEDSYIKQGKSFKACFEINFSLRDD